jgi:hypothetical protein
MKNSDLEKRVARLEALVAQLSAWHDMTLGDIVTLEQAIDVIDEHLDLGIDIATRSMTAKAELMEELSIDVVALETAVRQF